MVQPLRYGYAGGRHYDLFYRHSGGVTIVGVLSAALAGMACAVIVGIVYAYIDLYSPIIYLNLAVCAGFGGALGYIVAYVLRWGKVRNLPVSLAIVGVTTLVGYYVSWIAWIGAVFDRYSKSGGSIDRISLSMHPQAVWFLLQRLNQVGTFTIGNNTSGNNSNVSGAFLSIIWIVEAGGIFMTAFVVARKMISNRPFCERCDLWCDENQLATHLSGKDIPGVVDRLKQHDFEGLRPYVHSTHNRWISLTHHACPKCGKLHTITATDISIGIDGRGRQKVKKTVLIDKLLVTLEEVDLLKAIRLPPDAPATPNPI